MEDVFLLLLSLLLLLLPHTYAQLTFVKTIAGTGKSDPVNDPSPASSAGFSEFRGIWADSLSNLYIADTGNHRVRFLDRETDVVSTFAGGGAGFLFSGDGESPTLARLYSPTAVLGSSAGEIFIADTSNGRVRVVSAGIITTFAGSTVIGYDVGSAGDDGPAVNASLGPSYGLTGDAEGNVIFADYYYHRIRMISALTGNVTTIAGTGVMGSAGDGGPALSAYFKYPSAVATDTLGDVYVCDSYNYLIRKVSRSSGLITTLAGTGSSGTANGAALSAGITNCTSLWVDSQGAVFFTDTGSYRVRKLSGGIVSTIAGMGTKGSVNTNVPATNSLLNNPRAVVGDSAGNIYFSENNAHRIYKLTTNGTFSVVVGKGSAASSLDVTDGVAMNTNIGDPTGLFLDAKGNLVMAEAKACRVRMVNVFATGSTISTIAGSKGVAQFAGDRGDATSAFLGTVNSVWMNSLGTVYILDTTNYRIRAVSPDGIICTVLGKSFVGNSGFGGDGGPATAALLDAPRGLAMNATGALFISDNDNRRVRVVVGGIMFTFAGGGAKTPSLGDGGLATSAYFDNLNSLYCASDGSVYVADSGNHRVRRISPAGIITTIAGTGRNFAYGNDGPASSADLNYPRDVFVGSDDGIYIADTNNNRIQRIDPISKNITTFVGSPDLRGYNSFTGMNSPATSATLGNLMGIYYHPANDTLFVGVYDEHRIAKISLPTNIISLVAGTGATTSVVEGALATSATMNYPQCITMDSVGDLYFADYGTSRVRKLTTSSGTIRTVVGTGSTEYNGESRAGKDTNINAPAGVWVDTMGVLFFSEYKGNRIREMNTAGIVNTIAGMGSAGNPKEGDVAISVNIGGAIHVIGDGRGRLYYSDFGNHKTRYIEKGLIYTFAGTGKAPYSAQHENYPATSINLNCPSSVWFDTMGNAYIADYGNQRIRKVAADTGLATTIAGDGVGRLAGDDGPATAASLYSPRGVVGDNKGNLYIVEYSNCRVRKISLADNIIITFAGSGSSGIPGSGSNIIAATSSLLNTPSGITMDAAGNYYIADSKNYRVRQLFGVVYPTGQPTAQPVMVPTGQPTRQPTSQPTRQPFSEPTGQPTSQPVSSPSGQPTREPSTQPIGLPSSQPSSTPSALPSTLPSSEPSVIPTARPTSIPTATPSKHPTKSPTVAPSTHPTLSPTISPSETPSLSPTESPSTSPTIAPSAHPTLSPTTSPSDTPSLSPTESPSEHPTLIPTASPSVSPTIAPTTHPTLSPTTSPSVFPTESPSMSPTITPSASPTLSPTTSPSVTPTESPSTSPTLSPSTSPSVTPTESPSTSPTLSPSTSPSVTPTESPSTSPTIAPSTHPTLSPTMPSSDTPSSSPTTSPPVSPTQIPSNSPTTSPTILPSVSPTENPTTHPTLSPTESPSTSPTLSPTNSPSSSPTTSSSVSPAESPSRSPTLSPTMLPSATPSMHPTESPSASQSIVPSLHPTLSPTALLLKTPSLSPTKSSSPTIAPFDAFSTASLEPLVVIRAPSRIGLCEDLRIDLLNSQGHLGRDWSSTAVQVTVEADNRSINAVSLQDALSVRLSTVSPMVIPRSSLQTSSVPYRISFTLCNVLKLCATGSVSLLVTDDEKSLPLLSIAGSPQRTITRDTVLSLSATASVTECGKNVSNTGSLSKLSVNWQLWRVSKQDNNDTAVMSLLNVKSSSLDPLKFTLPAFALSTDESYEVRCTATHKLSGVSSSVSVYIFVKESPSLVARVSPNAERQSLRVGGKPLKLDALGSFDPDVSPVDRLALAATTLHYQWSFVDLSPPVQSLSNEEILLRWPNITATASSSRCSLELSSNASIRGDILSIRVLNSSLIGSVSAIKLTVSDERRSAVWCVRVEVVPSEVPLVSISSSLSYSSFANKVNANERISLTGSISSPLSVCNATWSVLSGEAQLLPLSSMALSSPSKIIAPSLNPTLFNLVLRSNALPAKDTLYTFQLSCAAGSSAMALRTNGAPVGGLLSVSPSKGEELRTTFTLSASRWVDVDLPLSYQFGYLSPAAEEMTVRARSETSSVASTLPAGVLVSTENDRVLNVTLTVFDALHASVSVRDVRIAVSALDQSQLQSEIQSKLQGGSNGSALSLSLDERQELVSVATTSLNAANCTLAPSCSALNRSPCAATTHTCGACLSHYLGETGEHNSLCIAADKVLSSFASSAVLECTRDDDCAAWQTCETVASDSLLPSSVSKQCRDKAKSCPRDCSGHGQCSFVSQSTGLPLSPAQRCSLFSTSCEAKCHCAEGFAGSDCSWTAEQLEKQRALRGLLVDGLAQVMSASEPSDQSLANIAVSLRSLVVAKDELSSDTARRAISLASTVIDQALSLSSVSSQKIAGVSSAVDSTLGVMLSNPDNATLLSSQSLEDAISIAMRSIEGFADVLQRERVGDVSSVQLDLFRISCGAGESISSLSTPVSPLETSQGRNATAAAASVSLSNATMSDSSLVPQLQMIETHRKLWLRNETQLNSTSLLSNPVTVKTQCVDWVEITIAITLQDDTHSFSLPSGDSLLVKNFTTQCRANELRNESFLCADSGIVLTHRCEGMAQNISSSCPRPALVCNTLDMSNQSLNSLRLCELVSSTPWSATCRCRMSSSLPSSSSQLTGEGRRLTEATAAADAAGVLTIALMVQYVSGDFRSTFNVADDLSSPAALQKVLTVIVMYSSLWAVGLLALGAMAYRQHRREVLKRKKIEVNYASQVRPRNRRSHGSLVGALVIDPQTMRKKLSDYVLSVLPNVFSQTSIAHSLQSELVHHHSVLKLLFLKDTDRLPVLTVVELLTTQTVLMFLLALLYDLQSPDNDGSCGGFMDESSCLRRRSTFDASQTCCLWTTTADAEAGQCEFHEIQFSYMVTIYCAVVTSVFTALLLRPIDYLVRVLSAPTRDREELTRLAAKISAAQVMKDGVNRNEAHEDEFPEHVAKVTRFIPEHAKIAHKQANLSMLGVVRKKKQAIEQQRTMEDKLDQIDKITTVQSASHTENAYNSAPDRRMLFANRPHREARIVVPVTPSLPHKRSLELRLSKEAAERFALFERNLSLTAQLLKGFCPTHELEWQRFEAAWALTSPANKAPTDGDDAQAKMQQVVKNEITAVNRLSHEIIAEMRTSREERVGVEVLLLFVEDILGRESPAAKIFRTKVDEDYTTIAVVSRWYKWLCGSVLVGMNVFFVYFSLLRGYQKGSHWQNAYLMACIAQMLIEFCVFETVECLYVHFFVSRLMSSQEIDKVNATLQHCVDNLCGTNVVDDWESCTPLNVPDHLFLSNRVAHAFPNMLESFLVLSHRSCLPGQIAHRWQLQDENYDLTREQEREVGIFHWLRKTVSVVSMAVVVVVANVPMDVQKPVLRFVEPLVFGGFTLLWMKIQHSTLGIAIFIAAGVCAVTFFVFLVVRSGNAARSVEANSMANFDRSVRLSELFRKPTRKAGEEKRETECVAERVVEPSSHLEEGFSSLLSESDNDENESSEGEDDECSASLPSLHSRSSCNRSYNRSISYSQSRHSSYPDSSSFYEDFSLSSDD